MPDENTEDEAKLQKLGKRLREGWARKHPMPERSIETVRDAVREEWEREQAVKRSAPSRSRKPEPPEPER